MKTGEFRPHSIGQKIFVAMFCVIVLTVLLFFISAYFLMNHQMEKKSQETTRKDLTIITEKLDMFFDKVEEEAVNILSNDACQQFLSEQQNISGADEKQRHSLYRRINETMQSVFNQGYIYRTVNFYDLEANAYPELEVEVDSKQREKRKEDVARFLTESANAKWIPLHTSPWEARNGIKSNDCISYLRKVYAGESGKLIGIMELEIYTEAITDLYMTIADGGNQVYILNQANQVQSSSQSEYLYRKFGEISWYKTLMEKKTEDFQMDNKEGYLYMRRDYPELDWNIVLAVPLDTYLKDIRTFTYVDIQIGILLLLIGTILARKLILSITNPLSKITGVIETIGGGNLDKRITGEYDGEIKLLTVEFNKMLDRTKDLMEQVVETEQKKSTIEKSLIQLQMTPHFFYNILESICGLIVIDDKKLAIRTIQLLSNFYRNVLSKGAEKITIGRELEIASSYLEIMTICYPDKFVYQIVCDEELKEFRIIKLTLQPLLENAIYHGIIASGKTGKIVVNVQEQEDEIEIRIEDNGGGIPKDELKKLMDTGKEGFSMNSFGVRNTDERLKMHFGSEYGLHISSQEQQGTRVEIRIPKEKI